MTMQDYQAPSKRTQCWQPDHPLRRRSETLLTREDIATRPAASKRVVRISGLHRFDVPAAPLYAGRTGPHDLSVFGLHDSEHRSGSAGPTTMTVSFLTSLLRWISLHRANVASIRNIVDEKKAGSRHCSAGRSRPICRVDCQRVKLR